MPASAWFAFKRMVENVKRDYPANFIEGPHPEMTDKALLTWDDSGYFRILFPCNGTCLPPLFYKEGKIHKHAKDGLWYIVVTPSSSGVRMEVASQT